jgi:hypothetical protein
MRLTLLALGIFLVVALLVTGGIVVMVGPTKVIEAIKGDEGPKPTGGEAGKTVAAPAPGRPEAGLPRGDRGAGLPLPRPSGAPFNRPAYEENEVVVANPPGDFRAKAASLGFTVIEERKLGNLDITSVRLGVPRGMTPDEAVALLRREFRGIVTDVNSSYDQSAGPAVKTLSYARWLIGWPPSGPGCGRGVRLGMIDAPVDLGHPALAGQKITFKSFHNPKREPGPAEHGTSIAAMLVGKPSDEGHGGILPEAELVAASMFEVNENGKTTANAMGLLKSLDWMIEAKPHAVNLSVAGADNKVVHLAFDKARKAGLVMVAAAGNWGVEEPAYPAAYDDVIAVTAVADKFKLYSQANRGTYIDFAAPGVQMWTAVPGGGKYQSGTSFASPYITALAGLAIANGVKPEADTVAGLLKGQTLDLGDPGRDKMYGWGYVQMAQKCGG